MAASGILSEPLDAVRGMLSACPSSAGWTLYISELPVDAELPGIVLEWGKRWKYTRAGTGIWTARADVQVQMWMPVDTSADAEAAAFAFSNASGELLDELMSLESIGWQIIEVDCGDGPTRTPPDERDRELDPVTGYAANDYYSMLVTLTLGHV